MELNWMAIIVATVAQFAVGAIWYTALFGKLWGQMHDFDSKSKEEQKEMMSKMGPIYLVQFLATILVSWILARLFIWQPDINAYTLTLWVWLGLVVPTVISGVLFGGTPGKWLFTKIVVMSFGALAPMLVAAAVLQAF